MSEQTRRARHSAAMIYWSRVGLGIIIFIAGGISMSVQASPLPTAATSEDHLQISVPKGAESKPIGKLSANRKPEWVDLTAVQKIALKPLFENWQFLGDTSKRKWIALSVNFQTMAPSEQLKLHARMNEWVALSQQERSQARLNFAQSKQVPPSHRAATWEAYQALSPEEKARLAQVEKEKKNPSINKLKHEHKPKLATAPIKIQTLKPIEPLLSASLLLDRHTLLLRAQPLENPSAKQ